MPDLAFGYEEAIGYCTDAAAVPDKDGITTLVRVLTLAAGLKAAGQTIADRLDEIARTYGLHLTSQLAFRVSELQLIGEAMARVRATPPSMLAGEAVTAVDLAAGSADLPPDRRHAVRGRDGARRGASVRHRAEAEVLPAGEARRRGEPGPGRGAEPVPVS